MNDDSQLCSFCLNNYSEKFHVITKCNHKFHYNCFKRYIEKLLGHTLKVCCPLCNQKVLDMLTIVSQPISNYEEHIKLLQDGYTINIPNAINWESDVDSYVDTYNFYIKTKLLSQREEPEFIEQTNPIESLVETGRVARRVFIEGAVDNRILGDIRVQLSDVTQHREANVNLIRTINHINEVRETQSRNRCTLS